MRDIDKSREDLINELVLLRKEKDLANKYLDLMGAMLIILNADKEVAFINKKGCRILGYNKDEIIGKNWFNDFLPEGARREAAEIIAKIFSGELETVECFETPLLCKNGKEQIISWHSAVLKNDAGDIVSVMISGEDITGRKNAEQVLKQQKYYLERAQQIGKICSWELDVKNNKLVWTDETCRIFGIKSGTVLTYQIFLNCVHPEDRAYVEGKRKDTLKKEPYAIEYRMLVDGKIKWVREKTELEFDVSGNCVRVRGFTQDITAQKLLEEEQAKQRYILEKAQSIGMLGSWEFNMKEGILSWSDEVYRIFGINPGTALTYELFLDRIHPDDREYVDRRWKAALNQEPYDIEHRILVDGKIKWVREKAELEFDENGDCFGCIGFTQDITEKKNTQDVLLDSLEKHRLFVENSPLGIIHYSFRGIITDVNDALIEILGLSRDKLIGLDLNAVSNKNFSKEVLKSLNGEKGYFEGTFSLQLGGKQAELNAHLIPIIIKGKVHSGVGIVEDITERKKLEQHIKANEAFLANIFFSIQDGISILDKDLNIIRVNKTMEKWYAHVMPLVGKRCYEAYHGRSEMCDVCPSRRAFTSGVTQSDRVPKIGADGKVVGWLELYAFPLRDDTGEVICVIENVRDITKRTKAEEQAKKLLLEKVAADAEKEKALELVTAYQKLKDTQLQLLQAEKLAGIGQLGAGIAHELNSPLTGVMSLLRSYKKEKDPSSIEYTDIEEMEKACLHMANVIKGLSMFSRQSTEEVELVDCNDAIEATLSFSGHHFKSGEVKIEKNYEKNLYLIKASKNQIQQVIVNMITNACDAMPKKGTFTITTRNVDDEEGKWIEMEFSDTGCGIAQESVKKIFDPFFTTKRPGGGVGLGLSIAHRIVENYKGRITVKSEEGQGAVFTVRLPAEGGNNKQA